MKSNTIVNALIPCAAEALKEVLRKTSAIHIREIRFIPPGRGRIAAILAEIEIYGRSHAIHCLVNADPSPRHLIWALKSSDRISDQEKSDQSTLIMTPSITPEVRAFCTEHGVGYFDLEGNARLTAGGLFIVLRSSQSVQTAKLLEFTRMSETALRHTAYAS